MQIGGSWLVRKGHCRECCVGRGKQGRKGHCVNHTPDQASDQGQSWLPMAPLHCQGAWSERWGEEPSCDWEQKNSLCGQHQVSGSTSSWDGLSAFLGCLSPPCNLLLQDLVAQAPFFTPALLPPTSSLFFIFLPLILGIRVHPRA